MFSRAKSSLLEGLKAIFSLMRLFSSLFLLIKVSNDTLEYSFSSDESERDISSKNEPNKWKSPKPSVLPILSENINIESFKFLTFQDKTSSKNSSDSIATL